MAQLIAISVEGLEEPRGDVIFVHGLDGDARATWEKKGAVGSFWPEWMAAELANVAVWSLDYDAASVAWRGAAMPLVDRATNILDLLVTRGVGRRPLVFIAHSLGGLLVKQLLRTASDHRQPTWATFALHTKGVVFLGTPHSGSEVASWALALGQLLRPNATLQELVAHAPQLRDLNLWYRNNARRLDVESLVYCETRKYKGIGLIVDQTSSDPGLAGSDPIPIDADHVDLPKIEGREDQRYRGILGFTRERLGVDATRAVIGHGATDILSGLPSRWAGQIDAFLLQYLGTAAVPAPFGGRQGNLRTLDDWLGDESSPRYGVLEARGGLGKSALLAHWVHRLAEADTGYRLLYFPISARWRTNSETALFEALSFRLASLFGEAAPRSQNVRELRDVVGNYLARAAAERRRLLLVIDGLDEAAGWEASTDLFPPRRQGHVRVLVAARPLGDGARGWLGRLGWNGSGVARTFQLDTLDQVGVADVLLQMGNPLAPLTGRLDVVRVLTEKSQGDPLLVGLYVNKLREEVGDPGRFDAGRLQQIEPGLIGFFQYWLDDQAQLWGEARHEREPRVRTLMALCSLAHGRLVVEDIQGLAPDLFDSRRAVEDAASDLRRLIIGDWREGYMFGHPRLGVFIREETLEERERHEYEQRFLGYGRRVIEDFQLKRRGTVPDYWVRWYSTHLWGSGRPCSEYRPLLTADWCAEWERVDGSPAGFVGDLDKAWDQAGGASELGVRIRVALLRASVLTRHRGISKELFVQCVSAGIISPTLAEVIARQQDDEYDVCEYLLVIAVGVNRERLLEAVLVAVQRVWDEDNRYQVLTAVIERLQPEDVQLVQHARAVAKRFQDNKTRSSVLQKVAVKLPPDERESVLEEALVAARAAKYDLDRAWHINSLCELLPLRRRELIREVLALARHIEHSDSTTRGNILFSVLERLHPEDRDLLEEWFELVCQMDESWRAGLLEDRLKDLSASDGESIQEVLTFARSIGNLNSRISVLTAASAKVCSSDRQRLLREALSLAHGDRGGWPLVDILKRLTAADSELLQMMSASLARTDGEPWKWTGLYMQLAQRLQGNDRVKALEDALAHAHRIERPDYRASALVDVARELTPGEREKALAEALDLAREIPDLSDRVSVLVSLAQTGFGSRKEVLGDALDAAYRVRSSRRDRVREVVGQLGSADRELLDRALTAAHQIGNEFDRAEILCDLVGRIDSADRELLEQQLTLARRIWHRQARVKVLIALASRVDPCEREQALERALAAARRIGDEPNRAHALSVMADSLGSDDRTKALAEALAAVRQIGDDHACVRSLGVVAQRFHPRDQALVQEALQIAQRIGDGAKRAIALSAVVDNLRPSERQKAMQEALAAACQTDDESEQASGLASLADHLSVDEWDFAASLLDAARQIGKAYLSVRVLASVAEQFPSHRQALLHEALKLADEGERRAATGFTMREVARRLAPDDRELLEQILLSTGQLKRPDHGARRNILQELVPRIAADDATLLRLALEVARQDLDRWGGPEALCIVARRLPQEEREPVIAELLAIAHAEKGLDKAMVLGNMVTLLTPDNQEAP